jgi:hypothetical protein
MQKLTINILRQYSEWYDYNLNADQLRKVYKELTFPTGIVSENDIFEEFDYILNN